MSSGDTTLTITGNLTGDPELRFTATGTAVVAFTVAASRRVYDQATGQWQDGDTLFLRCSAWRELADHAAESLSKGMRVIVTGRLKQRTYETTEGEKRTVFEVDADDVRAVPEVGHGQDRQNQPGQGAAPGRWWRPVAGPRTGRRRGGYRRRPAPVLARRTTEGRTLTRACGPHASPARPYRARPSWIGPGHHLEGS